MKKHQSTLEMLELFAFPSESQQRDGVPRQPPDHREREQALDVTRSWIVEAPAGSGKTGLLIQRYLKLLALPSVEQPEQVLAITFTVKAAGEIRDRVLEELRRANESLAQVREFERLSRELARAVLDRDEQLGWGLLDHPHRFNIRTIDSVCSEISRSLPLLSEGAALAPVEDASALYREAAERTLLQLGASDAALNKALQEILLHRDGNLSQVRKLLAEMLSLRDQWGRLVPLGKEMLEEDYLDREVLPQIEQTLVHVICQELSRISRLFPAPLLQELSVLAAAMSSCDGYKGSESPIAICARLHHAPGQTAEDLDHWIALAHLLVTEKGWRSSTNRNHLGFEIEKVQGKQLKAIFEQLQTHHELCDALRRLLTLPPPTYPANQWRIAKALFRVLYRALAELQIVFAERGECDFVEPSLIARTALRNEGASLDAAMGMSLQHLLVDEMQDTSTSQYELIQLLTQGWDGHSQTILLVGDPKQSIYLFRQARVERFIQTMQQQRLGDIPLDRLYLTANFRSQELLVHSFNEDFSRLFPASASESRPDEAPYVAAHPVRGRASDSQEIRWHVHSLPSDLSKEDRRPAHRRQAQHEALEIRTIIDQWRARASAEGKQPKIAVLVRNRAHLREIIAELKRERQTPPVPYRAVKIEFLNDRPEVLDLSALTRALLHPADRVAWLAVLRAPWCGLELADLQVLSGEDDASLFKESIEDLIRTRGQELSPEACERLTRIWPILQAAQRQRLRIPLSQLVERTWRSLGGDLPLTAEQRTNARMYFTLLDQLERRSSIDIAELDRRLSTLNAETPPIPGAVDLMTIHGAKGLEWDLVLIPALERRNGTNRSRLLAWNEITDTGENTPSVLLAPIASKGEGAEALNKWLSSIQTAREQAEARRLFYVACTRAREELHLFASPAEKKNGSIERKAGSLLHAAWPAAEPHFLNHANQVPSMSPIIDFPQPQSEDNLLSRLAAEAEPPARAILHRLPLGVQPAARLQPVIPWKAPATSSTTGSFSRPEGSFAARALGTAVHAFLELIAEELAAGADPAGMLLEIENWDLRIRRVLRSYGLSPQSADQSAGAVKTALGLTLRDPFGVWILSSHRDASSEHALTAVQEDFTNVRLDRIFRAGPEPLVPADSCLWIVDYKTALCKASSLEEFLSQEQQRYAAQLETYGRTMSTSADRPSIRLGLYFPMIPAFRWWRMPAV